MSEKILRLEKTKIVLSFKAAAVAIATMLFFRSDLMILFNDALQSDTTSYILIVPVLFMYLIYRKRKILREVAPLESKNQPKKMRTFPLIAGILLFAIAIMFYWYGSYTFTPLEYHMLTLPIFVAGLTLIFFNMQTMRQLIFPTAFLVFLMPPPSEILYAFGATLSILSSEASNLIVNAIGVSSTIISEYGNPTIVITRPDGNPLEFTVDIACSGIYSLIGFLVFAVFIAYIIRDKLWKKLAIIVIGAPLIYTLNITRITIILVIGYHYGAELALQIFHVLGGWILIFLGTLLLLTISEKVLKTQIFSTSTFKCQKCTPILHSNQSFCLSCDRILKPATASFHRADIAKVVATAATIALLISIQTPLFALAQGPPIVVVTTPSGQQISTDILPQISDYNLTFIYRDKQFEARAKQDLSLVYLYTTSNKSKTPIWVSLEIAPTRSSLHRWEVCLITWPIRKGYQPRVTQIELKDLQLTQNPPVISRYFAFQYAATNLIQVVLYWYETATFKVDSTSQQKHIKISLIAYPKTLEELPKIENQLMELATAIANYWQPIKTWSQIALLISHNGPSFVVAASVTLIATTFLYIGDTRKNKRSNANTYRKLSNPSRQIIDIVRETEKRTTPTLNNIAETYRKTTGQTIEKTQLLEKLVELEKTSIIKSQITSIRDEPIQAWKTQI